VKKICNFSNTLVFDAPVRGFTSEYRHPLWYGKTRMVSLPDGEKISKISLFVLAQLRNVTDRQSDGHRVTAYTALMHMHRAVKIFPSMQLYCVIVAGASPEETKMWAAVRENGDFLHLRFE